MTHTLHRKGDIESLKNDFVITIISAVGFNEKNSGPKKRKAMEMALEFNPVNIGNARFGNMYRREKEEILHNLDDSGVVQVVFDNKESLLKYLLVLKHADLGQSIIVSGLFDEVNDILKKVGHPVQPHTVQYSLGFFGKKEILPDNKILEITTMCGHSLVSDKLVEKLVEKVKEGKINLEEASHELAKQCQCGVFNPQKAYKVLKELVAREQSIKVL